MAQRRMRSLRKNVWNEGKVTVIFLIVAPQSANGAGPALKLKSIAGFYKRSAKT